MAYRACAQPQKEKMKQFPLLAVTGGANTAMLPYWVIKLYVVPDFCTNYHSFDFFHERIKFATQTYRYFILLI